MKNMKKSHAIELISFVWRCATDTMMTPLELHIVWKMTGPIAIVDYVLYYI